MIDLSTSKDEVQGWLLVCNMDYAPHTWSVQNFPYYRLFESLEAGRKHIREENRSEPGFFPRGSYQFLYGVWSNERIHALQDVLHAASGGIY